jgi:transcriptional regulator with XRE-family HTH domain
MRIEEVIGQRMKDFRELEGMSQRELGEGLEPYLGKPWSRQAVSTAETGGRAFTAIELITIAAVLGTSVSRLMTLMPAVGELETPGGVVISGRDTAAVVVSRMSPNVIYSEMQSAITELAQRLAELETEAAQAARSRSMVFDSMQALLDLLDAAQNVEYINAHLHAQDDA